MKYLLLLLFTFSAHAQFKLEITMSDSKYAKREIVKDTKEELIERFIKVENKFNIAKGEWKESPESEISKEETYLDSVDTGETRVITNIDGEEETVPIFESVEKTRTLYYHPINFSVAITDITQELADKETERLAAKAARQELKALKQTINDSDLPNWHKKLLKYLIKEIRE